MGHNALAGPLGIGVDLLLLLNCARALINPGPLRVRRIVLHWSLEDPVIQSQIVTLSTKGQLVLPQAIRTAASLRPGSTVSVTLEPDGTISVHPIRGKLEAFFHSLDGVAATGPVDVDAAILEAVEGMDDAARQR